MVWDAGSGTMSWPMTTRSSAPFNDPQQRQMFMYSSKTDSWKKIPNFNQGPPHDRPFKFVNGRLYWLRNKEEEEEVGGTNRWYIVSLDLVEEKYQTIHCFSGYDYVVLEDLGGYLSLICYDYELHAMKKGSWSKIWTFSDQDGRFPMPIWLKKNGDIVVTSGSDVVVYHGKYKLRQSRWFDVKKYKFESIIYVESLVAPIGDDEQLRQ